MDFIAQPFQQYPVFSALASVLVVATLLSIGSRYLGKITLSDLTVGPKQLLKDAAVTSALYAALVTAVAGLVTAAVSSVSLALPLAAVAGMVAFINALSPAFAMQQGGSGKAEVVRRKNQGKEMAARCLRLFQRLDRRGNGLLNEDDLNAAITRTDLTVADKEALIYVRDHAEHVGTVVERTVTSYRVVPGGMGSGIAVVVPQTIKHYAVSADDLNTYPSRLELLYRLWD